MAAATRHTPTIGIFAEAGKVVDAAPASLGQSAQLIAGHLSATEANVEYTVADPVLFFDAGIRYTIHTSGQLAPYALAGVGLGQVKPDVEFTIGGTNVNSSLAQYGVALGSDMSGTTTKIMIVLPAGVSNTLGEIIYLDSEFRYNRVFMSDRRHSLRPSRARFRRPVLGFRPGRGLCGSRITGTHPAVDNKTAV